MLAINVLKRSESPAAGVYSGLTSSSDLAALSASCIWSVARKTFVLSS
jgi:hypothetical protein